MSDSSRQLALDRTGELRAHLQAHPERAAFARLIDECQHLERAIDAFHMEGIRFRTYTLDRLLHGRGGLTVDAGDRARELFTQVKTALEAAGFHTK
jgi:hypothetical protein